MKRHFTTKGYDYQKYHGKVKANFETFRTRNDAYFFAKLAKKDDYENLLLANMVQKPEIWIREIVDDVGYQIYIEWIRKIESLGYIFKSELNELKDDYKENFMSYNGQHPYIATLYMQRKISLETFTILSHSANIFAYWEEKVVDKIIFYDIITKSKKYKPFLVYDQVRFKQIIKDKFF
jgi:hypothetical protein